MSETVTPLNLCPACGYAFDRASDLDTDSVPRPGDVSICLSCGALLQFDADLRSVAAAPGLMDELSPRARRQVLVATRIIKARGPLPAKERVQ